MERGSTRSCMYRCCTGTYSLDAVARIGSATFLVEGLQLIIAILLMALGLIIVINSLKAYFKAQKESA